MDLVAHKCRALCFRPWPGTAQVVALVELTPVELREAEHCAQAAWAMLQLEPEGALFRARVRAELVARAARAPAPPWPPLADVHGLLERTSNDEIAIVHDAWLAVQSAGLHGLERLRDRLLLAMGDGHDEIMMDGLRAYASKGAEAFYGLPLAELTDGQLLYYLHVRSAFGELHGPDAPKGRAISRRWIEQRTSPN